QMTRKAYDSEPLPISFTEEQYRQNRFLDYLYVLGTNELTMGSASIPDKWMKILQLKIESNPDKFKPAFKLASNDLHKILANSTFPEQQPDLYASLPTFDSTNTYFEFRNLVFNILTSYDPNTKQSTYALQEAQLQSVQD